jgi:hypothetical protein
VHPVEYIRIFLVSGTPRNFNFIPVGTVHYIPVQASIYALEYVGEAVGWLVGAMVVIGQLVLVLDTLPLTGSCGMKAVTVMVAELGISALGGNII